MIWKQVSTNENPLETHKTRLTAPLFIEVPVSSQENEWSSICVLEVSILPLCTIFRLDFVTVPTVWYFYFHF